MGEREFQFVCGEHFCETCSDCMHCYGDEATCLDGGSHYFDRRAIETHPEHAIWNDEQALPVMAMFSKIQRDQREGSRTHGDRGL